MRSCILLLLVATVVGRYAAAPLQTPKELILSGTIVPMNGPPFQGAVYIRDSLIERVVRNPYRGADAVVRHALIYPGLIDIHNHPLYNVLGLWRARGTYANRYCWRNDSAYVVDVKNVQDSLLRLAHLATEIGIWAEVRALAGGTVALQGWRLDSGQAFRGILARNVEEDSPLYANFGRPWTGHVSIDLTTDTLFVQGRLNVLTRARPWILHLAEGTDGESRGEFATLAITNLIGPNLVLIHGVALDFAAFRRLSARGAHLVWSPLSNFLLYGKTTQVDSAKLAGVSISLGSDWAPSGSKNLLGELKVADRWNKQHGTPFSDEELAWMVTRNPAEAIGWGDRVGMISKGNIADLLVLDSLNGDPYRNLIEATERNVQLVMVGGDLVYGDAAMLRRADPGGWEIVGRVGGRTKAVRLTGKLHTSDTTHVTFARVRRTLRSAFRQPWLLGRAGLDSLFTAQDSTFFLRIRSSRNVPTWLKDLESSYR